MPMELELGQLTTVEEEEDEQQQQPERNPTLTPGDDGTGISLSLVIKSEDTGDFLEGEAYMFESDCDEECEPRASGERKRRREAEDGDRDEEEDDDDEVVVVKRRRACGAAARPRGRGESRGGGREGWRGTGPGRGRGSRGRGRGRGIQLNGEMPEDVNVEQHAEGPKDQDTDVISRETGRGRRSKLREPETKAQAAQRVLEKEQKM
ncbi:uncharacterized protein LOC134464767 [Engraulis encrasicolus]|uniref:uncharacterized protein LOC134464767 n=1 Tax=Engraulis encrasicolus TaxID=184585 RepID=UPI002FD3D391